MIPIRNRFTAEQHAQITQAVSAAEARTSAEILPVVAQSSGRYDRAEDLVGLWLGLLCLTLTWLWFPHPQPDPQTWGGLPAVTSLIAYLFATVVGFVLGAWLASRIDPVRALFTPRVEMRTEVWQRARAVFFDQRIHHTTRASGVLIYLSLLEHRAVILADQRVLDAVGAAQIEELCQHLTARLHTTDLTAALCQTIDELATLLAPTLPAQPGQTNELNNALILLE